MRRVKKSILCSTLLLAVSLSTPVAFAESLPVDAAAGSAQPALPSEPASAAISIDFKEADINTVLRVLSIKSGVNIVAGPEVTGTVTVRLENVPWEKALDVVLRTYDYVYERSENIIRVTTRDKMALEPVITQAFVLNYAKAEELQVTIVDMLTERGRVKAAERTNMIVITDIPTQVYHIGETIKKLDKRTPQAYVDSKIVRTQLGVRENLGIEWNLQGEVTGASRPTTFPFALNDKGVEQVSPFIKQFYPPIAGTTALSNANDTSYFPNPAIATQGNTFTFGALDFSSFRSALQLLKERDNTKIVSNPRIVVLNNQTAKVHVGDQIPLPSFERNENTGSFEITGFNYRDVGVVMNVTPHINSAEEILVDLKPEVSQAADSGFNFGDFIAPQFSITQAETQVLIRSGETIAIGGLLTDNVSTTEDRVPFFSEIPLIGKLFRSKRQTSVSGNAKTETLFFVTVTMVDTEGQPTGELAKQNDQNSEDGESEDSPESTADSEDETAEQA